MKSLRCVPLGAPPPGAGGAGPPGAGRARAVEGRGRAFAGGGAGSGLGQAVRLQSKRLLTKGTLYLNRWGAFFSRGRASRLG